jgi:nucleotide-binding universal stress UspA family protein
MAAQPGMDPEPDCIVDMDLLTEGILSAARQFKADLIVMGANQSRSVRLASHLPWSTVHEVIHDAPCPVLTVAG